MTEPDNHRPPPKSPDSVISSVWFEIFAALISGFVVATVSGQNFKTLSYWGTFFGAAVVGVLVVFYIRNQWFLPQSPPELGRKDRGTLAESITSSRRSAHAISSNWISLWRSSAFRYYLHLDAVMSLIAYSSRFASPLATLSTDKTDTTQFLNEGLALVEEIGNGAPPPHRHRFRLLIYPEWVYERHTDDILQLIRSHSAARIPCLPLVADELYDAFDVKVQEDIKSLVNDLDQDERDKRPPVSRVTAWRDSRRLKRGGAPPGWSPVFPDILLIDSQFHSLQTAKIWWYTSRGQVRRWEAREHDKRETANRVFAAICRNATGALWTGYNAEALGSVAVAADTSGLGAEAFFAWPHYKEWLKWIKANLRTDKSAKALSDWLDSENAQIDRFLEAYLESKSVQPSSVEILDLGCGFGRHLIDVLATHKTVYGVGVDINTTMLAEVGRFAKRKEVHRRATFLVNDMATLSECKNSEFDLAICMTNTLGNLPKDKQEQAIQRLKEVLRPGGQALISVYAVGSVEHRLKSYREIGLNVEEEGRRIVAAEGLESEAFEPDELLELVESSGLVVAEAPQQLTSIGWQIVASRPLQS